MRMDERGEYDSMLAEAWAGTTKARHAGRRLVELLRDAEQAQVRWAGAEVEQLTIDGAATKCRTWRQAQNPRVPTAEGRDVKTTGGARERDESTGQPAGHVQLAFADMDRPQLGEHIVMLSRQVETERATIAAIGRLIAVLDRVPEAATPREACARLGTTVEAVMAGEAAA
jgi:hypothetical protein